MANDQNLYAQGDSIAERFTVQEFLGTGGMGEVYKVEDDQGGLFACKVLLQKVVPGFVKTGKITTAIIEQAPEVPGLVRPLEVFEDGKKRCILSDFVDGSDLRSLMADLSKREEYLDQRTAAIVADKVLTTLSAFPPLSVHGLLKPGNILLQGVRSLDDLNEDTLVFITDFGASRVLSFSKFASIQLARGNDYYYLAPEFISQGGRVKKVADIYALGIMLYESLTGLVPKKDFKPLSEAARDVDEAFSEMVAKAISKQPDERFQEFGLFREALRETVADLPEYVPPEPESDEPETIETEDIFAMDGDDDDVADQLEDEVDVFGEVQTGDPSAEVDLTALDEAETDAEVFARQDKEEDEDLNIFDEVESEEISEEDERAAREIPLFEDDSHVEYPDSEIVSEDDESEPPAEEETTPEPEQDKPQIEIPVVKAPQKKAGGFPWVQVLVILLMAAAAAAAIWKMVFDKESNPVSAPTPPVSTPPPAPTPVENVLTDEQKNQIADLVAKGTLQKEKEQLLEPKNDNLLTTINKIKAINPTDQFARNAKEHMVAYYLGKAQIALNENDLKTAAQMATDGMKVDPNNQEFTNVLDKVMAEKKTLNQ